MEEEQKPLQNKELFELVVLDERRNLIGLYYNQDLIAFCKEPIPSFEGNLPCILVDGILHTEFFLLSSYNNEVPTHYQVCNTAELHKNIILENTDSRFVNEPILKRLGRLIKPSIKWK